jgi:sodium transport system permease protein
MVILFIGPALFAQFVNMENIEAWWFIAPIFNICLGMRASLLGDVSIIHAILWMSSSLLYALVATGWASKQFNREDLVESIS